MRPMCGLPLAVLLLVSLAPQPALSQAGQQTLRPARALPGAPPPARRPPPLPKPAPGRDVERPLPARAAIPLPLPRPKDLGGAAAGIEETPAKPPANPPEEAPPAMDEAELAACLLDFAEQGGVVIPGPPPTPQEKQAAAQVAACTIPGPVTFAQVKLPDGRPVRLESAITVRCTFAREIAAWIRDDLAPIATRAGGELAQLSGVGGYACRPRNGQAGAQISEHASGNALDILALTFSDGRVIDLWTDTAETKEIRAAVRESVCKRFFTVLGPGSDAAHANHLHIDLRARRNGYRMCQWDVK